MSSDAAPHTLPPLLPGVLDTRAYLTVCNNDNDDNVDVHGHVRVQLRDAHVDACGDATSRAASMQLLVWLSSRHTLTRVDVHTSPRRRQERAQGEQQQQQQQRQQHEHASADAPCCTRDHVAFAMQRHAGRVCFAATRRDSATAAATTTTALRLDAADHAASVDVAALTMSLAPVASSSDGDGSRASNDNNDSKDGAAVSTTSSATTTTTTAAAAAPPDGVLTLVFDSEPPSVAATTTSVLASSPPPPPLLLAPASSSNNNDKNDDDNDIANVDRPHSDDNDTDAQQAQQPPPRPRRVLRLFRPPPPPEPAINSATALHDDVTTTAAASTAGACVTSQALPPVAALPTTTATTTTTASATTTTVTTSAVPAGTVVVRETTADELRRVHDVVPCVVTIDLQTTSAHEDNSDNNNECSGGGGGDSSVVVTACTLHFACTTTTTTRQPPPWPRGRTRTSSTLLCGDNNDDAFASLCPRVSRLLAAVDTHGAAVAVKHEDDDDDDDDDDDAKAMLCSASQRATAATPPLFTLHAPEPVVQTLSAAVITITTTTTTTAAVTTSAARRCNVLVLSTLPTRVSQLRAIVIAVAPPSSAAPRLLSRDTANDDDDRSSDSRNRDGVTIVRPHSVDCVELYVPTSSLRYVCVACDVALVQALHALLQRVLRVCAHALHTASSDRDNNSSNNRSDHKTTSTHTRCLTVVVVQHASRRLAMQRGVDVSSDNDDVIVCAADTVRAACGLPCARPRRRRRGGGVDTTWSLTPQPRCVRACVALATALCTRQLRRHVDCAYDNNTMTATSTTANDDDDDDDSADVLLSALAHAFALAHAACWLPHTTRAATTRRDAATRVRAAAHDARVCDVVVQLLRDERALLHAVMQTLRRARAMTSVATTTRSLSTTTTTATMTPAAHTLRMGGMGATHTSRLARYAARLHTTLWLLSSPFVRAHLSCNGTCGLSCAAAAAAAEMTTTTTTTTTTWPRGCAGALHRVLCLLHTLVCRRPRPPASPPSPPPLLLHATHALQQQLHYETGGCVFDMRALRAVRSHAPVTSRVHFAGSVAVEMRSVASSSSLLSSSSSWATSTTAASVHVLSARHASWSLDVALQWRSVQRGAAVTTAAAAAAVTGTVVPVPLLLLVLTLSPMPTTTTTHTRHASHRDDGGDTLRVRLSSAATFVWQLSALACLRGHAQHTTFSVVRAPTLHDDRCSNDGSNADDAVSRLPLHVLAATPHAPHDDASDGVDTRNTAAMMRKRTRSTTHDDDNKDDRNDKQAQRTTPLPRAQVLLPLLVHDDSRAAPLVDVVVPCDDTFWHTLYAHATHCCRRSGDNNDNNDDNNVARQCATQWAAAVLRHIAAHSIAAVLVGDAQPPAAAAATPRTTTTTTTTTTRSMHAQQQQQHAPLLLRGGAAVRCGYAALLHALLRSSGMLVGTARRHGAHDADDDDVAWRRDAVRAALQPLASLAACVRTALHADDTLYTTTRRLDTAAGTAVDDDDDDEWPSVARVREVLWRCVLAGDVAAALSSYLSSSSSVAATAAADVTGCDAGDVYAGTPHEAQRARDALSLVCRHHDNDNDNNDAASTAATLPALLDTLQRQCAHVLRPSLSPPARGAVVRDGVVCGAGCRRARCAVCAATALALPLTLCRQLADNNNSSNNNSHDDDDDDEACLLHVCVDDAQAASAHAATTTSLL